MMNELPRYIMMHQLSGISGYPDASVVWPCGSLLLRIKDHWFFARELKDRWDEAT